MHHLIGFIGPFLITGIDGQPFKVLKAFGEQRFKGGNQKGLSESAGAGQKYRGTVGYGKLPYHGCFININFAVSDNRKTGCCQRQFKQYCLIKYWHSHIRIPCLLYSLALLHSSYITKTGNRVPDTGK